MEKIKAGIIGFGRVAGNHLRIMRETGVYEMVGVCDITASRRDAAMGEGLRATDDLDAFLNWDIELVLIATHSAAHYADALKVAAAKKHMLIEKPMALTGPQAEEMVQAAKDNGVMLTLHHNRHFDRDYCLVKRTVLDGAVGEVVAIENRTLGARPAVGFGIADYDQQWRVTAAAGGGTLLDFGPHWVEQVIDLMAGHRIVSVFADVRHTKWGDADDLFDIVMVFDNGVRARAAKADISHYALPYKWIVLGTEATLVCGRGGAGEVTIYSENGRDVRTEAVPRENLHMNIARHLREGEALIITAEHGLRVMQVLHAARISGASGKSVDVAI